MRLNEHLDRLDEIFMKQHENERGLEVWVSVACVERRALNSHQLMPLSSASEDACAAHLQLGS
jgi:hypothetical protein